MKSTPRWYRYLWPVSVLYSMVARFKAWCYARGIFKARRLPGTVISVGNLTVGGTGKTPMVLAIAERLAAEGKHCAILTRGYRGTTDPANKEFRRAMKWRCCASGWLEKCNWALARTDTKAE